MAALAFFMPCIPPKTSHHAKKIVRIGGFSRLADKPELTVARQTIDALLLPHQIPTPVAAPYRVALTFTWPWLAGHPRRFRAAGRQPMTSKPDLDNVSKSLCDRLVALRFIEDDRQIVDLRVRKFWGAVPGVAIAIDTWTAAAATEV